MKKFVTSLLVLLTAYAAYPYFALYRLGQAFQAHDPDAVAAKVDWPRVRQGVKDDVNAAVVAQIGPEEGNGFAALGVALAGKLAGPFVDAAVTPAGLIAAMDADRPTLETLVTRVYISTTTDQLLPRLVQSRSPVSPPSKRW